LQTRVGLHRGDNARMVKPDELTRLEIQRVKTIFRTVGRLMEVAVNHFDIQSVLEGRTHGGR
jgi:pyrroline-5-carboxylate reductase